MGCNSLNALRCEEAAKKVSPRKLPPTEDSFHQHVLRTAYQLMMWRQSDKTTFSIPDPLMFGYYRDESNLLCPVMMTQSVAAPELLNNLICQCKDKSCSSNCSCFSSNQPCTSACNCMAIEAVGVSDNICTNPLTLSLWVVDGSDSDNLDDWNDINEVQ